MKDISKSLGTIFIVTSLALFAHIYYPIIIQEITFQTHLLSHENATPKSTEFGLVIEKIGVNEQVFPEVDPFNPQNYHPILLQGLAHAKGSALPGTQGTIYIFGHSSDNPFSITKYNTSFFLLRKLSPQDRITLYYHNQPYSFQVRESKVVSPFDTKYLHTQDRSQLILQTCTPVGTSLNRLLVFADPVIPSSH